MTPQNRGMSDTSSRNDHNTQREASTPIILGALFSTPPLASEVLFAHWQNPHRRAVLHESNAEERFCQSVCRHFSRCTERHGYASFCNLLVEKVLSNGDVLSITDTLRTPHLRPLIITAQNCGSIWSVSKFDEQVSQPNNFRSSFRHRYCGITISTFSRFTYTYDTTTTRPTQTHVYHER